ncbi:hypothetical protein HHK36_025608 [Tetracentron sinense]|uniref:CASP-like protein n=1 Tax=Tetracentron sinense TaxID=13715 RepID=A0A834YNJ0_TETSI|nr:hypothetical protein HHK36_025608 [Tetracentron sinense]
MMNGRKNPPEIGIQMLEAKVAAESASMSGPLVSERPNQVRRKSDVAHAILRLICLISSIIAVSFMTTAKEAATISIYGFHLPVYAKWSFSDSFEYLVGISAAVVAHSLLQLLLSVSRLLRKLPVISSRNHAWLIFAGDQGLDLDLAEPKKEFGSYYHILSNTHLLLKDSFFFLLQAFAYVMMSAGSAASGVTNLNRTGIRHSPLPDFCKPLHLFCDRIAISIVFSFFSCFLLATSAVLDVIWLSKY